MARQFTETITDLLNSKYSVGDIRIICDTDSALPARHGFSVLKAKRADVSDTANPQPIPHSSVHVCAVFNYAKFMLFGNRHDALHVRHGAISVYWNDAFGPLGYRRRNLVWIDAKRVRFDIDKYRARPNMAHGHGCRVPSKRWDD